MTCAGDVARDIPDGAGLARARRAWARSAMCWPPRCKRLQPSWPRWRLLCSPSAARRLGRPHEARALAGWPRPTKAVPCTMKPWWPAWRWNGCWHRATPPMCCLSPVRERRGCLVVLQGFQSEPLVEASPWCSTGVTRLVALWDAESASAQPPVSQMALHAAQQTPKTKPTVPPPACCATWSRAAARWRWPPPTAPSRAACCAHAGQPGRAVRDESGWKLSTTRAASQG
jgi:hypothetical protein